MSQPENNFTSYEFWIFVLTVFHSNQHAQSLSIPQQQALLTMIRKKHCPDITDKQWLNIELNIVNQRNILQESMLDSALASAGIQEDIFTTDEMANFNSFFIKELQTFDLNSIKEQLKQKGITNSKLNDLLDLLESKKKASQP